MIAEYDEDLKDYIVLKPKKFKGQRLKLFRKDGCSKHFMNTNVGKLFPEIENCVPVVTPDKKDGKYYFKNWIPEKTVKSGWSDEDTSFYVNLYKG